MNKNKREFSKTLLIQESVLIWITTIVCLALGGYCIYRGFTGALPWISSIIISSWSAYGVSQMMYYRKSMAENTEGGVKFESVLEDMRQVKDFQRENTPNIDYSADGVDYSASTVTYSSDDYQI